MITPKYVKTPIINGAPDVKLKGDEMHIENYLVLQLLNFQHTIRLLKACVPWTILYIV